MTRSDPNVSQNDSQPDQPTTPAQPVTKAARHLLSRRAPERIRGREWVTVSFPTNKDWLEAILAIEREAAVSPEPIRATPEFGHCYVKDQWAGCGYPVDDEHRCGGLLSWHECEHGLPASPGLDGIDHVSERCPNKFRCRLTVGGVAGYATERLQSADLAAHFWVGCRRITMAEADALRARLAAAPEPADG